ncbi:MAG TPA: superoxide dismutase family protein [Mycobacterium sp.]
MKTGIACAVAVSAAAVAPLAACTSNQQNSQPTSTTTGAPAGTERLTTELKSVDGAQVGNATFDFANGYATVTVQTGPNQVLSPGFHALMVHAVGKCEGSSASPTGGATGDFESAGGVYQAPDHTGFPASGDLTALQVRNDGSAKLVTTTSLLRAADLRSSSGTALVVHQFADNLSTSPTGESGKRIACGVITSAAATSSSTTTSVSTVTTTVAVPPPATSTSTSTVTVTSTPTSTSTTTSPVTTTYTPPP